jgi:hypothetical protein
MRNEYKIVVAKAGRKGPLGRCMHMFEDNIKLILNRATGLSWLMK